MFAFGKLYELSLGKNILKLLRFLAGLLILLLFSVIVGLLIGIAIAYFGLI